MTEDDLRAAVARCEAAWARLEAERARVLETVERLQESLRVAHEIEREILGIAGDASLAMKNAYDVGKAVLRLIDADEAYDDTDWWKR